MKAVATLAVVVGVLAACVALGGGQCSAGRFSFIPHKLFRLRIAPAIERRSSDPERDTGRQHSNDHGQGCDRLHQDSLSRLVVSTSPSSIATFFWTSMIV